MALTERVSRLEEELAYLRAIVDGGEAQAREAIVVAAGLFISIAARSGGLDYDTVIACLAENSDPEAAPDDRTEMLLRAIRGVVAFHRDEERGQGGLSSSGPTVRGPATTPGETVAADRTSNPPGRAGT